MEPAMSAAVSAAPAAQSVITLPAIGALFGGGYFAGQLRVDGTLYGLVMAGAAGDRKSVV